MAVRRLCGALAHGSVIEPWSLWCGQDPALMARRHSTSLFVFAVATFGSLTLMSNAGATRPSATTLQFGLPTPKYGIAIALDPTTGAVLGTAALQFRRAKHGAAVPKHGIAVALDRRTGAVLGIRSVVRSAPGSNRPPATLSDKS
jgi:hypothetical protein